MTPYDNLSRIEIIGPDGREFVAYYEPGAMLDLQDDERTLKVFVGWRRDPHADVAARRTFWEWTDCTMNPRFRPEP